jgi:hypothetical protein
MGGSGWRSSEVVHDKDDCSPREDLLRHPITSLTLAAERDHCGNSIAQGYLPTNDVERLVLTISQWPELAGHPTPNRAAEPLLFFLHAPRRRGPSRRLE